MLLLGVMAHDGGLSNMICQTRNGLEITWEKPHGCEGSLEWYKLKIDSDLYTFTEADSFFRTNISQDVSNPILVSLQAKCPNFINIMDEEKISPLTLGPQVAGIKVCAWDTRAEIYFDFSSDMKYEVVIVETGTGLSQVFSDVSSGEISFEKASPRAHYSFYVQGTVSGQTKRSVASGEFQTRGQKQNPETKLTAFSGYESSLFLWEYPGDDIEQWQLTVFGPSGFEKKEILAKSEKSFLLKGLSASETYFASLTAMTSSGATISDFDPVYVKISETKVQDDHLTVFHSSSSLAFVQAPDDDFSPEILQFTVFDTVSQETFIVNVPASNDPVVFPWFRQKATYTIEGIGLDENKDAKNIGFVSMSLENPFSGSLRPDVHVFTSDEVIAVHWEISDLLKQFVQSCSVKITDNDNAAVESQENIISPFFTSAIIQPFQVYQVQFDFVWVSSRKIPISFPPKKVRTLSKPLQRGPVQVFVGHQGLLVRWNPTFESADSKGHVVKVLAEKADPATYSVDNPIKYQVIQLPLQLCGDLTVEVQSLKQDLSSESLSSVFVPETSFKEYHVPMLPDPSKFEDDDLTFIAVASNSRIQLIWRAQNPDILDLFSKFVVSVSSQYTDVVNIDAVPSSKKLDIFSVVPGFLYHISIEPHYVDPNRKIPFIVPPIHVQSLADEIEQNTLEVLIGQTDAVFEWSSMASTQSPLNMVVTRELDNQVIEQKELPPQTFRAHVRSLSPSTKYVVQFFSKGDSVGKSIFYTAGISENFGEVHVVSGSDMFKIRWTIPFKFLNFIDGFEVSIFTLGSDPIRSLLPSSSRAFEFSNAKSSTPYMAQIKIIWKSNTHDFTLNKVEFQTLSQPVRSEAVTALIGDDCFELLWDRPAESAGFKVSIDADFFDKPKTFELPPGRSSFFLPAASSKAEHRVEVVSNPISAEKSPQSIGTLKFMTLDPLAQRSSFGFFFPVSGHDSFRLLWALPSSLKTNVVHFLLKISRVHDGVSESHTVSPNVTQFTFLNAAPDVVYSAILRPVWKDTTKGAWFSFDKSVFRTLKQKVGNSDKNSMLVGKRELFAQWSPPPKIPEQYLARVTDVSTGIQSNFAVPGTETSFLFVSGKRQNEYVVEILSSFNRQLVPVLDEAVTTLPYEPAPNPIGPFVSDSKLSLVWDLAHEYRNLLDTFDVTLTSKYGTTVLEKQIPEETMPVLGTTPTSVWKLVTFENLRPTTDYSAQIEFSWKESVPMSIPRSSNVRLSTLPAPSDTTNEKMDILLHFSGFLVSFKSSESFSSPVSLKVQGVEYDLSERPLSLFFPFPRPLVPVEVALLSKSDNDTSSVLERSVFVIPHNPDTIFDDYLTSMCVSAQLSPEIFSVGGFQGFMLFWKLPVSMLSSVSHYDIEIKGEMKTSIHLPSCYLDYRKMTSNSPVIIQVNAIDRNGMVIHAFNPVDIKLHKNMNGNEDFGVMFSAKKMLLSWKHHEMVSVAPGDYKVELSQPLKPQSLQSHAVLSSRNWGLFESSPSTNYRVTVSLELKDGRSATVGALSFMSPDESGVLTEEKSIAKKGKVSIDMLTWVAIGVGTGAGIALMSTLAVYVFKQVNLPKLELSNPLILEGAEAPEEISMTEMKEPQTPKSEYVAME